MSYSGSSGSTRSKPSHGDSLYICSLQRKYGNFEKPNIGKPNLYVRLNLKALAHAALTTTGAQREWHIITKSAIEKDI